MKFKLLKGLLIAVGFLVLNLTGFNRIVYASAEGITDFDIRVDIQKDGRAHIIEVIKYNFGTNQKHGIYRDIPLSSANGPQLKIDVLKVSDELDQSYQYSDYISGGVLHIKIGDANAFVTGIKTYVIDYNVYNSIRTFSDHDEFYWNVTGNNWGVTIDKAAATIYLPQSLIPGIDMTCYTGSARSTAHNCSFINKGASFKYETLGRLNPNEGLTVVLGMPLGYIQNVYVEPKRVATRGSVIDSAFLWVSLSIMIGFAGIIAAIVIPITRRFSNRKPNPIVPKELKEAPLIVEYNPPDDLPPIEVGTILDRKVDPADISATIMNLAVRGYLKIKHLPSQGIFAPLKNDFELTKIRDGSDLTHPADRLIFNFLFDGDESIKLSDLQASSSAFGDYIKKISDKTEKKMEGEGYIDLSAEKIMPGIAKFFSGGLLTLSILILIFSDLFGEARFFIVIPLIAIGASIFFVAQKDKNKLTQKGIATFAKIVGFREFLMLTEKDKLELLNAPEVKPETFEKFLPYAIALGVEDKWAKKFEGIYNVSPVWYEDQTISGFNSYLLVSSLNSFNTSFNQVAKISTLASSNRGGFSSGFSGGGFSGGGGGGGGGGSW